MGLHVILFKHVHRCSVDVVKESKERTVLQPNFKKYLQYKSQGSTSDFSFVLNNQTQISQQRSPGMHEAQ